MGAYINIGNAGFRSARNGEYVDKSGLIAVVNDTLNSKRRFSCVTRSRRFGKSMAAEMLCAYYDYSCDSRQLFDNLEISKVPSFEKHLNKYPVLYLDMTAFVTRFHEKDIVGQIDAALKKDVLEAFPDVGGRCLVDPTGFQNDVSIIHTKDDVLTVLIHLGYLSYDWQEGECYIPNREVEGEMVNAVKVNNWSHIVEGIEQSRDLLQATLDGDAEAVAKGVEAVHDENIRVLSYNNENSLALVLTLAYYFAKKDYIIHRELPTGKGFADVVFMPRKNVAFPAIIFELKYDDSAKSAIAQIKQKEYFKKLSEDVDDILLVGINYDRKNKKHVCQIEWWQR